jgi:hypothetical protein
MAYHEIKEHQHENAELRPGTRVNVQAEMQGARREVKPDPVAQGVKVRGSL